MPNIDGLVDGDRSSDGMLMVDGASSSTLSPTPSSQIIPSGKFTLTIDCESLLKQASNSEAMGVDEVTYTSKTATEVAQVLRLCTLLPVCIVAKIKIKCWHTCGRIKQDREDRCLETLWAVGDWCVEAYRGVGREARTEHWQNGVGTNRDLDEPDAVLTVMID